MLLRNLMKAYENLFPTLTKDDLNLISRGGSPEDEPPRKAAPPELRGARAWRRRTKEEDEEEKTTFSKLHPGVALLEEKE